MTTVAGNSSLSMGTSLSPVAGQPLTSTNAGFVNAINYFAVANSVIYIFDSATNSFWSGAVGGSWVQQTGTAPTPDNANNAFVVDSTGANLYYVSSNKIYKITNPSSGTSNAVMIKDFTGVFTYISVGSFDYFNAHSLILMANGFLYRYTDSLNIP